MAMRCLAGFVLLMLLILFIRNWIAGSAQVTFNRSRWKRKLTAETRRQFQLKNWKVTEKKALVNLETDLSVKSAIATFEIVCLDPTLNRFMSETRILERFEALARELRLRGETLLVVTNGTESDGFIKSAMDRGLVLTQLSQLHLITCIIDYSDCLPDSLDGLTLRALANSPSACASLMYRFKAQRNLAEAVAWGHRALKSHYGYFVHYTLFSLLIETGELDLAERVGADALSFRPKEPFRFFQGFQKIAALRRDESATLAWANRWIEGEPDNPLAYANLASVHQNQGDGSSAVVTVKRALELAPTERNILRTAVKIALSSDDLPAARAFAEQWVSQAVGDAEAHELLADVLFRQLLSEEAALSIGRAMKIGGDSRRLLRKASLIAFQRGEFDDAIQFAEQWRAAAPDDAWAHDHLSKLYLRSGDHEKARAASCKALELDPTNSNFQRRAQQVHESAG